MISVRGGGGRLRITRNLGGLAPNSFGAFVLDGASNVTMAGGTCAQLDDQRSHPPVPQLSLYRCLRLLSVAPLLSLHTVRQKLFPLFEARTMLVWYRRAVLIATDRLHGALRQLVRTRRYALA